VDNDLLIQFLELMEAVDSMKRQKYQHRKAYYQKHFGKDTFSQSYYDQLVFDFETIEKLDDFFNRLSQDFPLLAEFSECLWTLKKERENGQPIEWVQVWFPVVPVVRDLKNCYLINLLKTEDSSHE